METLDTENLIKQKFPEFEPELRDYLLLNGTLKEAKEGEVIIRYGQYLRSSMLVLEGQIKVYRSDEEGNELFLYFLEPGDSCAISMICGGQNKPGYLHAVASENSLLLALPLDKMPDMMSRYKSWYSFVLNTYRHRFEEILEVLEHVAFKSMDERLDFFLSKIAREGGKKEIKMTHEQIANDLGSSRVVISRLLKKMEEAGRVKLGRNSLEWLG
jgi:CRP/FNR family transcriptional regulator